jgi:peptidoglycan/LPS O-acetylase OafA/YrhL
MNRSYDGFRALAFIAIFLFHTGHLPFGYLGVQAFFVLSGYLITPILITTKRQNTFGGYYKNFIIRRALRIFPLYYAYLGTVFVLNLSVDLQDHRIDSAAQWWSAVGYVYNIYHATEWFRHTSFLSHFWSLAVEEQFYLGWPVLLFWVPNRSLMRFLTAVIFLGPLIRLGLATFAEAQLVSGLTTEGDLVVYLSTVSHLDAFATGAFFALLPGMQFSSTGRIFSLLTAVVVLGLGLNLMTLGDMQPSTLGYPKFMSGAYRHVWGYSLFNLIFGLILHRMKSQDFFRAIFESPPLTYLGKISYGLYVYHFGTIALIGLWFPDMKLKDLAALLVTVGLATISYYGFERHFINLKDRIAPKKVG